VSGAGGPADPEAPEGEWERHIAEVWQDTLGIAPIGRDDDFFALGGDSMKGLSSLLRIHPDLEWSDIFRNPTVRALAVRAQAVIGESGADGSGARRPAGP
jgi:hypothetical protein